MACSVSVSFARRTAQRSSNGVFIACHELMQLAAEPVAHIEVFFLADTWIKETDQLCLRISAWYLPWLCPMV